MIIYYLTKVVKLFILETAKKKRGSIFLRRLLRRYIGISGLYSPIAGILSMMRISHFVLSEFAFFVFTIFIKSN